MNNRILIFKSIENYRNFPRFFGKYQQKHWFFKVWSHRVFLAMFYIFWQSKPWCSYEKNSLRQKGCTWNSTTSCKKKIIIFVHLLSIFFKRTMSHSYQAIPNCKLQRRQPLLLVLPRTRSASAWICLKANTWRTCHNGRVTRTISSVKTPPKSHRIAS